MHLESRRVGVLHYLDDYFFIGDKGSNECNKLLQCFFYFAELFGIPLASKKTVYPVLVKNF